MAENTPTPADQLAEDWNEFMEKNGYLAPAVVPGPGADYVAGWEAARRRFGAERDALAAILAEINAWNDGPMPEVPKSIPLREQNSYLAGIRDSAIEIMASVNKAPADALAARDAKKWDEGFAEGQRQDAEGEDGPRFANPYRIEREAQR